VQVDDGPDRPPTREDLTRETWPIAAAMLPFPAVLPDGSSTQDQDAEGWAAALAEVVDAGFDHVDPYDSWLRVADLPAARLEELRAVLTDVGLRVPAVSISRRSVIDPEHGADNLAYTHRAVDAAAALGATVLNTGFFRALLPAQREALWFWTAQGAVDPDDPAVWTLAVERVRELGRHAAEVGLRLSLEVYEDTYLGTADSAVRLVTDVGLDGVGLNPDLGNLLRLLRPVERWDAMAEKVLPHANFWHVKNYFRSEDAATGTVVTAPAPLELGVMDYRRAVRMAVAAGFDGPITCEHYGGDGLSVSATNRDYLRRVLPR
jgi:sugar phosphate isomerase/epimerase